MATMATTLMVSTSQHTLLVDVSSLIRVPAQNTSLAILVAAGHVLEVTATAPQDWSAHMDSALAACTRAGRGGARRGVQPWRKR